MKTVFSLKALWFRKPQYHAMMPSLFLLCSFVTDVAPAHKVTNAKKFIKHKPYSFIIFGLYLILTEYERIFLTTAIHGSISLTQTEHTKVLMNSSTSVFAE
jgi:hypothetical protein